MINIDPMREQYSTNKRIPQGYKVLGAIQEDLVQGHVLGRLAGIREVEQSPELLTRPHRNLPSFFGYDVSANVPEATPFRRAFYKWPRGAGSPRERSGQVC